MKKFILSAVTIASLLGVGVSPVFANVIHANGSTGIPSAMGSNTGSVQGQANRSATGTLMKETNDGWATMG